MEDNTYTIRKMTRDEIDIAIDWAVNEGWNPGLYDADCFYETDPNGFFIGLLNGKPIGCISGVAYGKSFGFIGFYMVKPEFRKKGYGLKLWNEAMNYLDDRNIGLDGVVEQQENYKKSGFRLAYRNIRYQGIGTGNKYTGERIRNLSEVSFEKITAYDDLLFPAPRHKFIQCWIKGPQCIAFGTLDNSRLSGYGVLRVCRNGYRIGPLFADNSFLAEELLKSFLSHTPKDNPVFLDIPEINSAAVALAEQHNMKKVFEAARMYTKGEPNIPIERIFGVTSFELG